MEETIWSPQSPALEVAELPDIIVHHPIVVLHFWAIWNRHDRQFDAILQEVRPDYADSIAFYAVDMDNPNNTTWRDIYPEGKRDTIAVGAARRHGVTT